MFFTGEFSRSIDEKLRVAIPKSLREALECDKQPGIYVAPGTDQSLALYTEETFARLAERLAQASPTRQDVRAFNRLFYARAQRVELDGQGRVRIPPELAELARLAERGGVVGSSGSRGDLGCGPVEVVPGRATGPLRRDRRGRLSLKGAIRGLSVRSLRVRTTTPICGHLVGVGRFTGARVKQVLTDGKRGMLARCEMRKRAVA